MARTNKLRNIGFALIFSGVLMFVVLVIISESWGMENVGHALIISLVSCLLFLAGIVLSVMHFISKRRNRSN